VDTAGVLRLDTGGRSLRLAPLVHLGPRRSRRIVRLGVAVGILGFWFHTDGHLLGGIRDLLRAWSVPLGQDGGIKMGSRPPALAPLAFCGLGTLG